MSGRMRTLLLAVWLLSQLPACGAHQRSGWGAQQRGTGVRDYYPAAEGMIWAYDVIDPLQRHSLFMVTRVVSADARRAVLQSGAESFTRLYDDHGVRKEEAGSYLLREPLREGTSWALPAGGRGHIAETAWREKSAFGQYTHCLVVEEELDDIQVRTVLAPGIGPVRIQLFRVRRDKSLQLIHEAILRAFVREPVGQE